MTLRAFFRIFLFLALSLVMLKPDLARAQTTSYSHFFTNGTTYTPGTPQWDEWDPFRAGAPSSGVQSVTISGSLDATGRTCSDPALAQQIMDNFRTSTGAGGNTVVETSVSCGGFFWVTGDCSVSGGEIEFNVDTTSRVCSGSTYVMRPRIGNGSWGGVNSGSVPGPSQTMTLSYTAVVSPLEVTTTADSGAGSLREAITYANANAAEDNITFNIPGTGPHTIALTSSLPWISDDGVTIDGTTQSGASCGDLWAGTPHTLMIRIDGPGATYMGLTSNAANVSFKGVSLTGLIDGVRFRESAANSSVQCSYIGLAPDGTPDGNSNVGVATNGSSDALIGGLTAGQGNVISSNVHGIYSDNAVSGLMIRGNFIGTDPSGTSAEANTSTTIGHFSGVGTWSDITKNLISGNTSHGITLKSGITITGSSGDLVIAGNYIGVDRTGATSLPNGSQGIDFATSSASGVTIGGTSEADRNIIAATGTNIAGISLVGVSDIDIFGNYIGLGADGSTAISNTAKGIYIGSTSNVNVGDGTANGRNVIADLTTVGLDVVNSSSITIDGNYFGVAADGTTARGSLSNVILRGSTTALVQNNLLLNAQLDGIDVNGNTSLKVAILNNAIYNNGEIGIDLEGDGASANDSGDGDTGSNELLNFPVINSVATDGATAVGYDIDLDVPSNANGYRIEFFSNSTADPSGHGEGETFLGFFDTGNHAGGNINYTGSFTASEAVSVGNIISATTTRKTGASAYDITSEFASNQMATSAADPLVVTSTADTNTLGTLRYAITHANANTGDDAITFNIPGGGPHTISPFTGLPQITDDNVSIDGTSQSGTVCNTLVTGTPHVLKIQIEGANTTDAEGLILGANNVAVSGLAITGFDSRAIRITGPSGNGSVDCSYLGVNPDGTTKNANAKGDGVGSVLVLAGDGAIVTRSVVSGNDDDTGDVGIFVSADTIVLTGNIIGLSADGTTAMGNASHGLNIRPGASNVTLGGNASSDRNIISSNGRNAVNIDGTSNISVLGNYIGTDYTGLIDRGNGGNGIDFVGGTGTIGGTGGGQGNIIAFNGESGVDVPGSSTGTIVGNTIHENDISGIAINNTSAAMAIYENSIYGNTGLGIDLGTAGVTDNDTNDSDSGPNDLLNFPVINSFTSNGATAVSYDFNLDVPNNPTHGYRIDFYKNSAVDASGYGEGETHLGFLDVLHAGGDLNFTGSFTSSTPLVQGDFISATATRKTGASSYDITSEFALNTTSIAPPSPLEVTSAADTNTLGTLRYAITHANANAGEDAITFAIPGAGPHVIALASGLPEITDDGVSIDGTTQSGAACGDLWAGMPHTLKVSISANGLSSFDTLTISGDDVEIKGVSFVGDGGGVSAVWFRTETDNSSLTCSYVGLNPDGTANGLSTGVAINGTNITIGGSGAEDGNVISSNIYGISFFAAGSASAIEGNFIGTDPLGTTARANSGTSAINNDPAATSTVALIRDNLISGNTGHGLHLPSGSTMTAFSGNVIIAGNYIGIDRTGTTALANGGDGINFTTGSISGVTIGGTGVNDGNVISGNVGGGIDVDAVNDLTVLGNIIGLNAAGTAIVANNSQGVRLDGATAVAIGDGTSAGRNIISGNDLNGIVLNVGASDVTILGNYLGVATDGVTDVRNEHQGIWIPNASDVSIGDGTSGGANIIAYARYAIYDSRTALGAVTVTGNVLRNNRSGGITKTSASLGSLAVIGNSIYDNANLGMDLGSDGVTANDSGDSDSGPNDFLNFPVINDFTTNGNTAVTYDISLDMPFADYRIDFYKNTTTDASGYGEGETHLGFAEVTHPGGVSQYTGTFTSKATVLQGNNISATTTRKTAPSTYDITSEFSLTMTTGSPTELVATKSVDVYDPTSAGLYALPGNDVISSLTVTNPGSAAADADTIVIIDLISAEVEFYNGDIDDGGPQTNAVGFEQSSGAGITFTYAADVKYSNSGSRPANMLSCTYTPSVGYDDNVTYICINPKGALTAGDPDPNFTVSYRTRIK